MLGEVVSVREHDYIRHQADYQIPEYDLSRINYYFKVYPSDVLANEALEARSKKMESQYVSKTWEDKFDKSGQNVGRMLKESSVRNEGDSTVGYCSYSYVKGSAMITIVKMFECEPAKSFLQELSF